MSGDVPGECGLYGDVDAACNDVTVAADVDVDVDVLDLVSGKKEEEA